MKTRNRFLAGSRLYFKISLIALSILCLAPVTAASAAQKNLTVGVFAWPENVAVTHTWKQLLERHGYKVNLVLGGLPLIWSGVAKGDEDLLFEAWLPYATKPLYEKFKDDIALIGPWYDKAWQGLAVPDYVHIKSIAGLKDHAEEFKDRGQAKIYCADPGTVVSHHAKIAIKKYDLPFKALCSTEAAALTQLSRARVKQKPVVVTIWDPHWAWGEYKIHMLDDPKHAFTPPNKIYIITRKGFKQEYPKLTQWLSNFHLTREQLSDLMVTVKNADSADDGASEWIKHNKDIWQKWFQPSS